MLGPSAGTLRCVQDRKGRGGARPDLVFTMVSGVSLHRGSPLGTLLLVTAQIFSDSSSRERDAVCLDRIRRLQLVRCLVTSRRIAQGSINPIRFAIVLNSNSPNEPGVHPHDQAMLPPAVAVPRPYLARPIPRSAGQQEHTAGQVPWALIGASGPARPRTLGSSILMTTVGWKPRWSCPEACGKSERVFRSRRSHFCVTRMVSGRLL